MDDKFDDLNRWLTLLANVGVIVGIVFLAVEVRQNTASLEMNRQIALADAYANRNNTVQGALVDVALSEDFAEIYVRWQQDGLDALTATERFRVETWEVGRMFRVESQYVMWEQGLLPEDFIDTLRELTLLYADKWRELGIIWIPSGGYQEELQRALESIDGESSE